MSASFIDRFAPWSPAQADAAEAVRRRVADGEVTSIRLMFADQHGLLRGKTVMAGELERVFSSGLGAPSSLLLKDTSGRTVIPSFAQGAGLGVSEMQGAADLIMVPDPTTFRVLPWSAGVGWMLCDIRFTNGGLIPFSTRDILRSALQRLSARGLTLVAGAELEFHLYRLTDQRLALEDAGQPGAPPDVALLTHGSQYLWDDRYDQLDGIHRALREGLQGLGLPLASLEVEFGPSQGEATFAPQEGMDAADLVILARIAIKQIARRHGVHATFMCRPKIVGTMSSGWHLHQSLRRSDGTNALVAKGSDSWLSPDGSAYMGGLLAHAAGVSSFVAPTINAYRRYRAYSLAPDRASWGRDNRGAMVRLAGEVGSPSLRLENRAGEPAANPYLYLASQVLSGLDGLERGLDPGPSADTPYEADAPLLPRSLDEALLALEADQTLVQAIGPGFVDYWTRIKRAELTRFHAEVTDWEQREYFDLF
ncbi:MAG TPA: glutamine synthetase family protein [Caulobacteraceae bacterium]|nr:glutamine synthetase family protein [Caulobacteraceae bacterium]